jgi:choice-of-anchor C domain-containing protein
MLKQNLLAAATAAAALAIAGSAGAATIVNGGFTGPITGVVNVGTGSTVIPGWTVTSGNVDWIQGYWQSADGDTFSIDLNGFSPGAISQTIATVVGQTYDLTFDMSGNPDNGSDVRTMLVSAGGPNSVFVYTFTVGPNGHDNMNWVQDSLIFKATSTSTAITFTSGSGGAFGPALDNVRIASVPEPASWALMLTGFFGMGSVLRRGRGRTAAARA